MLLFWTGLRAVSGGVCSTQTGKKQSVDLTAKGENEALVV